MLHREPEMKRTICKRCGLVFVPGVSADLNIVTEQNGKTKVCKVECSKCSFTKRFVLNKNYNVWVDDERSIKEKI